MPRSQDHTSLLIAVKRILLHLPLRSLNVRLGLFAILLGLTLTACGSAPTPPTPTPLPPTPTVNAALFPTLATLIPTSSPTVPAPQLETFYYTHPTEIFRLIPPKRWTITEGSSFVEFDDPDGKGKITICVVNTGLPLDDDAFERFVQAREKNLFAVFDGYAQLSEKLHKSIGEAEMKKSLSVEGRTTVIQSSYLRLGQAIVILDFWADQTVQESYFRIFSIIREHVSLNAQVIPQMDVYATQETFLFSTSHISTTIPTSWMHTQKIAKYTLIDTFASPDKQAFIQAVIYDDGQAVSLTDAGAFIRTLLRNYYAEDIIITSDLVVANGRERLHWYSNSAGYSGDTVFEVKGTAFLLFTVMYNDNAQAIYADRLEQILLDYIHR